MDNNYKLAHFDYMSPDCDLDPKVSILIFYAYDEVAKGSVVYKLSSKQTSIKILNLPCDLDHSNSIRLMIC